MGGPPNIAPDPPLLRVSGGLKLGGRKDVPPGHHVGAGATSQLVFVGVIPTISPKCPLKSIM